MTRTKPTSLAELSTRLAEFAAERDWDQFHTPKNLSMSLAIEAAEVMELFQWLTEAQSSRLDEKQLAALKDELADVMLYLVRLASRFDIDLLDAAAVKMQTNAKRYPVQKAKGVARKYTEL